MSRHLRVITDPPITFLEIDFDNPQRETVSVMFRDDVAKEFDTMRRLLKERLQHRAGVAA